MSRVSTILSILLASLSLCPPAVAAPTLAPSLASPTLKNIERSTTIMIDTKSGNYCTVFPISEDGYLLTAVHCLKRCLESAKTTDGSTTGTEILCADQTIPSLGVVGVKVVAIGDALAPGKKTNRFGDYAVLKIETKKALSCLALSQKPAVSGDSLWAMGYPVSKSSSKALSLSASVGRLYDKPEQSRYYKAQRNQAERNLVSQLYSRDAGVMYSDAHHMPGQSGGPVVNKDGAVIGIVSGFTVTQSGKKEIHELVAGSTDKILKSIPLKLSSLLMQKSRDCQARL